MLYLAGLLSRQYRRVDGGIPSTYGEARMDLLLVGLPAAVIVTALVEVVKTSTGLPSRWAPLVALFFGVLLALLARLDDPSIGTWFQSAMLGIVAGLSASGLYSGQKSLRGG